MVDIKKLIREAQEITQELEKLAIRIISLVGWILILIKLFSN